MGIFTRFRDIISSNINSMLDRAEDPVKLLKLMIREMEDTLIEMKASCAGVMASGSKIQRQLDEARSRATHWEERAALAVKKGRDDLAREALMEKRRYTEKLSRLEDELSEHNGLIAQYQDDIRQLEDKLSNAREKQRMLVQRHIHSTKKKRAQEEIRRMESTDATYRFGELENRIERMEAEADLVNLSQKTGLEAEFGRLVVDEEIENELRNLKSSMSEKGEKKSSG
jgi:phage shock protein A